MNKRDSRVSSAERVALGTVRCERLTLSRRITQPDRMTTGYSVIHRRWRERETAVRSDLMHMHHADIILFGRSPSPPPLALPGGAISLSNAE